MGAVGLEGPFSLSIITYVSKVQVFGTIQGDKTNEVEMSARNAFSFAISGRVLVNSV